jgi:hypothetical protein
MYAELAGYCFPTLRAIDVKADIVEPAPHAPSKPITLEEAERTYKQLEREIEQQLKGGDPMTEEDARNAYLELVRSTLPNHVR